MRDLTLRYDKLKEPFAGHALTELLLERGSKWEWTGSFSFITEDEYKQLKWNDTTAPEADREIDRWTGAPGNQYEYAHVSAEVPTFSEILIKLDELKAEYVAYAGKRAREYPRLPEQLDMLYKDIGQGLLGEAAKTSQFYTTIKEIKESNQ
jgi:hypothetical protein